MVFNSNNFTFNNVYSKDVNIHLVTEDGGVLNDYGIPFNIENHEEEITLSFCYANDTTPLKWSYEVIVDFLGWMITEEFCEFISEDNEDVIYFLKGVGYKKRFTNSMTGIIDVTFKVLSPYGFKHYIREISSSEKVFDIYNYSNIDNAYKPVIVLSKITSKNVTLKNITTNKEPLSITEANNLGTIYIDNLTGTVTDGNGSSRLSNSNRSWIELKKGLNKFLVDGTCNIVVEAYYPIMI